MDVVIPEVQDLGEVASALIHNCIGGIICVKYLIKAIIEDEGRFVSHDTTCVGTK